MCASTASGRGRSRQLRRRARGRSGAPRPSRVRAPNERTPDVRRQLVPADARRRARRPRRTARASARTRSSVWASTGWSASSVCVTKTSRTAQRAVPAIVAVDELAHLASRAARASSASRRSARARPRRAAPRARGRRARARAPPRARPRRPGARAGPRRRRVTRSGMPPASVATTRAAAGERLDDDAAEPLRPRGSTSTVASSSARGDRARVEPVVVLDPTGEVRRPAARRRPAASRCRRSRAAPRAAARRRAARRRPSPSMFLYGSSAPTKSDRRPLRQRRRRPLGERREVAEGGEDGARRAARARPRSGCEVNVETARVASACRTASAASRSATGPISRREGEP